MYMTCNLRSFQAATAYEIKASRHAVEALGRVNCSERAREIAMTLRHISQRSCYKTSLCISKCKRHSETEVE